MRGNYPFSLSRNFATRLKFSGPAVPCLEPVPAAMSCSNDSNRRRSIRPLRRFVCLFHDIGREVTMSATITLANDHAFKKHNRSADSNGFVIGGLRLYGAGAKITLMGLVLTHDRI